MQIAGSACFVCGQNIGIMRDGAGCIACDVAVHRTCSPDHSCPKCKRLFLTAARLMRYRAHSLRGSMIARRASLSWPTKTYSRGSRLSANALGRAGIRGPSGLGNLLTNRFGPTLTGCWRACEGGIIPCVCSVVSSRPRCWHGWPAAITP